MNQPSDQDDRRAPSARTVVNDWKGWVPNSDPHDLPPGASPDLLNCTCVRPGELSVRRGAAAVKFS